VQEVLVSSQHSYPTLIDWEHLGDVEEPRVKTMSPYEWIEVENKLKHLCDAFCCCFFVSSYVWLFFLSWYDSFSQKYQNWCNCI